MLRAAPPETDKNHTGYESRCFQLGCTVTPAFSPMTGHLLCHDNVVGVMKMGNIVPRAGLEPTSLAFWVSVLPLDFPDVTTILTPTCLCSYLPQRSVQTTTTTLIWLKRCSLLTYIHICLYIRWIYISSWRVHIS